MRYLLTFLTLIFLVITGFYYQNKSLALHFVDEEDNMVLGNYILKGEKLYSEVFSHHQPLSYILSAGVQKVFNPGSIFLLIKRHREVVIIFSLIASVLLVYRFGIPALIFSVVYELTKIYLLGNLFLSESLAVYPLIYLFLLIIKEKDIPKKVEIVFAGFCFSFCFLTLAPIWPVLGLLLFLFFKKLKFGLKNLGLIMLGALPLVIISLFFLSVKDYFFNAFYINFKYYIPTDATRPTLINIIKSFASPYMSFNPSLEKLSIVYILRFLSLMLSLFSILLIIVKRYKLVLFSFLILGLANIRFIEPGLDYYRGFHLLPWFGLLVSVCGVMAEVAWKTYNNALIKIVVMVPVLVLFFVCFENSKGVLFKKNDLNKDWYINYSEQFNIGEAVRIMKTEGETLFVAPDEWLVYWQAQIPHASKMVNYYAWMLSSPELSGEVYKTFKNSPPTYVYCTKCGVGYLPEEYFQGYEELVKHGRQTNMFIKKGKLESLRPEQVGQLKYHGYEI